MVSGSQDSLQVPSSGRVEGCPVLLRGSIALLAELTMHVGLRVQSGKAFVLPET